MIENVTIFLFQQGLMLSHKHKDFMYFHNLIPIASVMVFLFIQTLV